MSREGWYDINRFNHGDLYVKRGLGMTLTGLTRRCICQERVDIPSTGLRNPMHCCTYTYLHRT